MKAIAVCALLVGLHAGDDAAVIRAIAGSAAGRDQRAAGTRGGVRRLVTRADSVAVSFVSLRDAWLETKDFAGTHRVRLWADPDVAGKSRVTVEAVYRPRRDPSRTARDLERASPPGSPGQLRAQQLLTVLKDKLGVTSY
jgi:hypothetical protein